ncbi:hypothetical protein PRBEI_2000362900 [Prionailurus iriomotensis]
MVEKEDTTKPLPGSCTTQKSFPITILALVDHRPFVFLRPWHEPSSTHLSPGSSTTRT